MGNIANSGISAAYKAERAGGAMTDNAATLFGIAAARDAWDTGKEVLNAAEIAQGNKDGHLVGVSIEVGYSQTKSDSKQERHDTTVAGSYIQSGGDTTIIARGTEGESGTGDIAVIGSVNC